MSDIPGTTRDAIDTPLEWNGQPVRLVDTAGMRRRGKVAGGPGRGAVLGPPRPARHRSRGRGHPGARRGGWADRAGRPRRGLRRGRGRGAGRRHQQVGPRREGRPDVRRVRGDSCGRRRRSWTSRPSWPSAPRRASASVGPSTPRWRSRAADVGASRPARSTASSAMPPIRQPPPPVRNRRPKFFYATQASIEPPTFVLFASGAEHVHFSYRRYLENRLRDAFGFGGTPLRLVVRERSRVRAGAQASPKACRGTRHQACGSRARARPEESPTSADAWTRRQLGPSWARAPGARRSRCCWRGPAR